MMERPIAEVRRASWDFPWMVAQATYHNPNDTGSPEIRAAQASLWKDGLALRGLDTGTLTGPTRQNNGAGVQMSARGRRARGD